MKICVLKSGSIQTIHTPGHNYTTHTQNMRCWGSPRNTHTNHVFPFFKNTKMLKLNPHKNILLKLESKYYPFRNQNVGLNNLLATFKPWLRTNIYA